MSDTGYWLRIAATEPARCEGCQGYAEAERIDVLTGEVVLRCGAYHRCGWRSTDADRDERQAEQMPLFGDAA